MAEPDWIYGIAVDVPEEFLDRLMDAIDAVMEPVYPGYRRCFSYFPVTGTWIPQEGSDPYDGEIGKISRADEIRLKFVCRKEDLERVLSVIDEMHPYEEPAVDVIPQMAWRSLLH